MRRSRGFTIVELLIVIVVIGILAAITIVAYNGVQNRANDAVVQSDLENMAKAIQSYGAINGDYPDVTNSAVRTALGLKATRGSYDVTAPANSPTDLITRNLIICIIKTGATQNFGIAAMSKSGTVYSYSQSAGAKKEAYTWIGQQSSACPRLGISNLLDPAYVRAFAFQSDMSGWQAGW
jgi:prepilin-type N-terminal cleavage/methylation domain-containing protein